MTEERGRPKKPPLPLDRRAVAKGARDAVQGNNSEQSFAERIREEVRRQLLINDEPEDTFAEGVRAGQHFREHVCPNGDPHPLGPYIPTKPATRKLSTPEPGEVVEFQSHHIALFEALTKPVTETLIRFLQRLYRREVAFGWIFGWWKQIGIAIGLGWGWAKWGQANWPDIKSGLLWALSHLP